MRKRLLALTTAALMALLVVAAGPAGAAEDTILTYSISEARAYSYKISLRDEVIALASQSGCEDDPDTPYDECDASQYNHTSNCPSSLTIGPQGAAPGAELPPGTALLEGGSGEEFGTEEPPQSTAVRLNELLSLAKVGQFPEGAEASGLASDTYVDLDGRQNPEAHTESDGFVSNRNPYEERCWSGGSEVDEGSYGHFLSRSGTAPETYHLAECVGDQCSQSESTGGRPSFEKAQNIVHLFQKDGKVFGRALAMIQELSFQDGAFTVESLVTYMEFESDGTGEGLRWGVATTASGTRMGGVPIPLPPGETVAGPGGSFYVGTAAPFVKASDDGSQLTIVAPGMTIGTEEQAAFFGGAELRAGLGRSAPPLQPTPRGGQEEFFEVFTTTGIESVPTVGSSRPADMPPAAPRVPTVAEEPRRTIAVTEYAAGPTTMGTILGLGAGALLVALMGWFRRFGAIRALYGRQPFRTFDFIYRAFVKT